MDFSPLGAFEFWGVLIAAFSTLVIIMKAFLSASAKKDSIMIEKDRMFSVSIDKLADAIDRLSDTDRDMKNEIVSMGKKIDTVEWIVGRITENVVIHDVRIQGLEEDFYGKYEKKEEQVDPV